MGLFKTKYERELDMIITRLEMNMSNNYKDNAQMNLKELEEAFAQILEAIEMAGDVLPLMLCRMEENEEPIPEASALSHLHLKANKTAVNIETDTMEYRKKLSV